MHAGLGYMNAALMSPEDEQLGRLTDLINKNVSPPRTLTPSHVFVRVMYLVSGEVNAYGGKFLPEEMAQLPPLIVDSPVLVGHRKDRLPIARNFHAELVERNSQSWVKSYFYWLKTDSEADRLRENIDGGVYKECSLAFTFYTPECSICGQDIRVCHHEPFQSYPVDGGSSVCCFHYRQIERVLETSLVYRGAVSDTAVNKDLSGPTGTAAISISHLDQLEPARHYLLAPWYNGVDVSIQRLADSQNICTSDGRPLDRGLTEKLIKNTRFPNTALFGQLVGYQGKSRCDRSELDKYLTGSRGSLSHVELKLYPVSDHGVPVVKAAQISRFVKVIPYRICAPGEINAYAPRVASREGLRIWPLHHLPPRFAGYRLSLTGSPIDQKCSYSLSALPGAADACFSFSFQGRQSSFLVRNFNLRRFLGRARFWAEPAAQTDSLFFNQSIKAGRALTGNLTALKQTSGGCLMTMNGSLNCRAVLQAARLSGKEGYLFYQLEGSE